MTYLRIIPEFSSTPYPLGRHVEHDERSKRYKVPVTAVDAGVKWWTGRHHGQAPILDQGSIGACTGFAAAGASSYLDGGPTFPTTDDWRGFAMSLYEEATRLDGIPGEYPPTDTGSTGLAAAKAVQDYGWASGYLHVFSDADLAAAIRTGPVMIGTEWYGSMFRPDTQGRVAVDYASGLAGGHEYVMDEVTDTAFGFRNSWGLGWGVGGRFYVGRREFLDLLLNHQGDAISLVPQSQPAPQPTPPAPAPSPAQPAGCLPGAKLLRRWFA